MSDPRYRQYTLSTPGSSPGSKKILTTWLPERKNDLDIVVGCKLTLSDAPGTWWKVVGRSEQSMTREEVGAMLTRTRRFGPSLDERDRIA